MQLVGFVLPKFSHFLKRKSSRGGDTEEYPLIRTVCNSGHQVNIDVIRAYIKHGADVSRGNSYGNYFSFAISFHQRGKELKELIEKKTDAETLKKAVNYVNAKGISVLQRVLSYTNFEVMEKFVHDWGRYLELDQRINFDYLGDKFYQDGSLFHHLIDRLKLLNLSTQEQQSAERIRTQVVGALHQHISEVCNRYPLLRGSITNFLRWSTSSHFMSNLEDMLENNFTTNDYPQLGFEFTHQDAYQMRVELLTSSIEELVGISTCSDESECILQKTFEVGSTPLEYLLTNSKSIVPKNLRKIASLLLSHSSRCRMKQTKDALSNKVIIEILVTYADLEAIQLLVENLPKEEVKAYFSVVDDQNDNAYHWAVKNSSNDPERFVIICYLLGLNVDPCPNDYGLNFLEVSSTHNSKSILENYILNELSEDVVQFMDDPDAIKAILKLKHEPILLAFLKRLKRLQDR